VPPLLEHRLLSARAVREIFTEADRDQHLRSLVVAARA
jgi:hypothetical protein